MAKKRVAIVVEGGAIQAIAADDATDIVLIDWDNIKEGGEIEVFPVRVKGDVDQYIREAKARIREMEG